MSGQSYPHPCPLPEGEGGRRPCAGTTLTEVIISMAVTALAIGGIVSGYVFSVERAEWSARSAAAQNLAAQRIEQARAAKWDSLASPPVDDLVPDNFPVEVVALGMPTTTAAGILATNATTITVVSGEPPLKMVRVDCWWPFLSRGLFTNTLITYRSPDQ